MRDYLGSCAGEGQPAERAVIAGMKKNPPLKSLGRMLESRKKLEEDND